MHSGDADEEHPVGPQQARVSTAPRPRKGIDIACRHMQAEDTMKPCAESLASHNGRILQQSMRSAPNMKC